MVKGLDKFREYFEEFTDNYVIIGGTACNQQFEEKGFAFRATKDIDIVLVVEALSPEFVEKFWQFVEDGQYNQAQLEAKEQKYYRFLRPQVADFPAQLELFSRKPAVITEKPGMHLTPIPVEGELESLSAILMDESYYQFTIANSQVLDGIRVASNSALISLKARAYLDMLDRETKGEAIDSRQIKKHKNDIIRLAAVLDPSATSQCPENIRRDMVKFTQLLTQERPDTDAVLNGMGIGSVSLEDITTLIQTTFQLNS